MPTDQKHSVTNILQWLQFFVLCIGVAGVFTELGRKTELITNTAIELTELKYIVQDLVKAQITIASNDSRHQAILDGLHSRLLILERR